MQCNDISMQEVERLEYKDKSLENIFKKFNECINSDFKSYSKKNKKGDLFNLNIRPGINYSSLKTEDTKSGYISQDVEYLYKIYCRFGVEAEIFTGFNKNKWAVFFEPNYHYYKDDKNITYLIFGGTPITSDVKVDIEVIQVPIGIRYYMYLNEQIKLFLNASANFDFVLNGIIDYSVNSLRDFNINRTISIAYGFGVKVKDRYSLEFNYNNNRGYLGEYFNWNTNLRSFSLILGYTIF